MTERHHVDDVQYFGWDAEHLRWQTTPRDRYYALPVVSERIDLTTAAAATTSLSSLSPSLDVPLPRGGRLLVWKSLLAPTTVAALEQEMLQRIPFKRYKVQGTFEPRLHCLYHALATTTTTTTTTANNNINNNNNATTPQPGYRYGTTATLTARPLAELPLTQRLADIFQSLAEPFQEQVGKKTDDCAKQDKDDDKRDATSSKIDVHDTANDDDITTITITNNNDNAAALSKKEPDNRRPNIHIKQEEDNTKQLGGAAHCPTKIIHDVQEQDDACFWNIGVNPVLYRNGRDKMGKHADDDQGESLICTAVVQGSRKFVVEPAAAKPQRQEVDFKLELWLQPGDVYLMNGEMQQHYVHSVPTQKDLVPEQQQQQQQQQQAGQVSNPNTEEEIVTTTTATTTTTTPASVPRMVLVFRRGILKRFARDTGEVVTGDPLVYPPKPVYQFGHLPGLQVGGIYKRTVLMQQGYHLAFQRSVSGCTDVGCDAIILSGTRQDDWEWDAFFEMVYAVEQRKGGGAVAKSFADKASVRIFRTSQLDDSIDGRANHQTYTSTQQWYRYDGLYRVLQMKAPPAGQEKNVPYLFYLRMANPDLMGDNPNVSPAQATAATTSSLYPDANANSDPSFSFAKPAYLGNHQRRLSRAQFKGLVHLANETKSESLVSRDCGFIFSQFTSALKQGVPLLRLIDACKQSCERKRIKRDREKARQREERARLKEERVNNQGIMTRSRRRQAALEKPVQLRKRQRRGPSSAGPEQGHKRGCSCRQFICSTCDKCSKANCPCDPCKCQNGPTRRRPFKARKVPVDKEAKKGHGSKHATPRKSTAQEMPNSIDQPEHVVYDAQHLASDSGEAGEHEDMEASNNVSPDEQHRPFESGEGRDMDQAGESPPHWVEGRIAIDSDTPYYDEHAYAGAQMPSLSHVSTSPQNDDLAQAVAAMPGLSNASTSPLGHELAQAVATMPGLSNVSTSPLGHELVHAVAAMPSLNGYSLAAPQYNHELAQSVAAMPSLSGYGVAAPQNLPSPWATQSLLHLTGAQPYVSQLHQRRAPNPITPDTQRDVRAETDEMPDLYFF